MGRQGIDPGRFLVADGIHRQATQGIRLRIHAQPESQLAQVRHAVHGLRPTLRALETAGSSIAASVATTAVTISISTIENPDWRSPSPRRGSD